MASDDSNSNIESNENNVEKTTQDESAHFVAKLYDFIDEHFPSNDFSLSINGQQLDLYRLYQVVNKLGGTNVVTYQKQWKHVFDCIGLRNDHSEDDINGTDLAVNQLKSIYDKYLHPFIDLRLNNSRPSRSERKRQAEQSQMNSTSSISTTTSSGTVRKRGRTMKLSKSLPHIAANIMQLNTEEEIVLADNFANDESKGIANGDENNEKQKNKTNEKMRRKLSLKSFDPCSMTDNRDLDSNCFKSWPKKRHRGLMHSIPRSENCDNFNSISPYPEQTKTCSFTNLKPSDTVPYDYSQWANIDHVKHPYMAPIDMSLPVDKRASITEERMNYIRKLYHETKAKLAETERKKKRAFQKKKDRERDEQRKLENASKDALTTQFVTESLSMPKDNNTNSSK